MKVPNAKASRLSDAEMTKVAVLEEFVAKKLTEVRLIYLYTYSVRVTVNLKSWLQCQV
jgi:hypothetical protein